MWKAVDVQRGGLCVVKRATAYKGMWQCHQEVSILLGPLRHVGCVIQLLGYYFADDCCLLALSPFGVSLATKARLLTDRAARGRWVDSIEDQLYGMADQVHRAKVVHRDIKPQNIIEGPDGNLLLLDFGLSADLSAEHAFDPPFEFCGTEGYISLNAALGGPPAFEDDVYSVHRTVLALRVGIDDFELAAAFGILKEDDTLGGPVAMDDGARCGSQSGFGNFARPDVNVACLCSCAGEDAAALGTGDHRAGAHAAFRLRGRPAVARAFAFPVAITRTILRAGASTRS